MIYRWLRDEGWKIDERLMDDWWMIAGCMIEEWLIHGRLMDDWWKIDVWLMDYDGWLRDDWCMDY